ncbi:hypothetical protein C2S52_008120 [Perilla frutescens var. hirtella]|nr:hypothetical protein C2S51_018132 [Perilla frutescens var. frutescens]KAH6783161.1 hypothetical protein C2S52_008120 [Perilla frutescens var. hirtella]
MISYSPALPPPPDFTKTPVVPPPQPALLSPASAIGFSPTNPISMISNKSAPQPTISCSSCVPRCPPPPSGSAASAIINRWLCSKDFTIRFTRCHHSWTVSRGGEAHNGSTYTASQSFV